MWSKKNIDFAFYSKSRKKPCREIYRLLQATFSKFDLVVVIFNSQLVGC